jgi:hypothetical protein
MKLKIQFESGCLGHVIVVCSTILVIVRIPLKMTDCSAGT